MTASTRFENCIEYCVWELIEQSTAKRAEVGPIVPRVIRAEIVHRTRNAEEELIVYFSVCYFECTMCSWLPIRLPCLYHIYVCYVWIKRHSIYILWHHVAAYITDCTVRTLWSLLFKFCTKILLHTCYGFSKSYSFLKFVLHILCHKTRYFRHCSGLLVLDLLVLYWQARVLEYSL